MMESQQPLEENIVERARMLLNEVPLIDGHNDFAYMIRGWFRNQLNRDDFDIDAMPIGQTDLSRLRRGGLGGQFWSAFVPCPKGEQDESTALRATLQQIDLLHLLFARFSHVFGFVDRADDIIPVFRSGRIASLIGIEGLHQINQSVSALRMMYRLGVRYATLCHNQANAFADSATAEPLHGGLSAKGKEVIREMNRIGMMIDLSHTSHETQMDVLAMSRAPVIFSHSSCFSICPNPRNVRDEVLDLLKKNNGLIMICFIPSLVAGRAGTPGDATVRSVADHIVYVGNKIGYKHAGIGSDFDGMLEGPAGLDDAASYPGLVEELMKLGVSDEDVRLVMGLNLVRVVQHVERVSHTAREVERWEPMCDEIEESWTDEQKAMLMKKGEERRLEKRE